MDLNHERAVDEVDGKNLAEEYNIPFYESSAKDRKSVEKCMKRIITDIINDLKNKGNNDKNIIKLINLE